MGDLPSLSLLSARNVLDKSSFRCNKVRHPWKSNDKVSDYVTSFLAGIAHWGLSRRGPFDLKDKRPTIAKQSIGTMNPRANGQSI
ncbi:hypothetical protein SBA1_320028 [Candidatus Sulfotelmatobacter kueseliae]|uniref:Uncharacterized protein n=1 Tax=Candidatus Sulfotelmatobacter kueseliae TaxID=2042962 RepID=A0A2U3KM17_9BACT|nr:hypothetical protein SBA1_320028 [Candidatus Sulfotelmatobacter kueseliae]